MNKNMTMNKKRNPLGADKLKRITRLGILIVFFFQGACRSETTEYCKETDFKKMEKIDIHCHINTKRTSFMEQAIVDNFQIMTINVDAGVDIEEQQEFALFQKKMFPKRLNYLTTFSMEGWDNKGWVNRTIRYISESVKNGAVGVKIWKNIGMVETDGNGEFIMIDNPLFDPIFDYLEQNNIPVCGHLGEPKNCWLPLDEMTVNNDRKYYNDFPKYHMYLHPDYPSYEKQIAARDNMLEKHPDLHFMGAHLGSMEWSVDVIAEHLDRFPNMKVDLAARMCHIQVQAQKKRKKVRDFFIKYQDRIIYGTDLEDNAALSANKLISKMHKEWESDWEFLTTSAKMTSENVDGEFVGLKLPKSVVEKIYFKNAIKAFPGITN
jgi:predicted TIM-barrel fold metal-dependent hydrolase